MDDKITYHAQVVTEFRIKLHMKYFNQIQLVVKTEPCKIGQWRYHELSYKFDHRIF